MIGITMENHNIPFFKNLLLELRKEVMYQIDSVRKEERDTSQKEKDGDLSGYSFHLADQGTDCYELDRKFTSVERDGEFLHEIDEALDRIEDGTYGRCEVCGNTIGWYRLEAIPYARLCVVCKACEEQDKANYRGDGYSGRIFPPKEVEEEEFEESY
jgi:RNA polymerase-binding protein DksA